MRDTWSCKVKVLTMIQSNYVEENRWIFKVGLLQK